MHRDRAGPTTGEFAVWKRWLSLNLSPEQERIVTDYEHDVILVAGGIGAGKSFCSALYTVINLPYTPRVWLVGAQYDDTRQEFEEIRRFLSRVPGLVTYVAAPQQGPREIRTRWGNVIRTVSTQDERRIAREGPNGIVMVEAAQQTREAFDRLWERLRRAERPDLRAWLFMAGTFEDGSPWYEELYSLFEGDNPWNGKSYSLPTWKNPFLYPDGEADPAIQQAKSTLPPERFAARFAGQPAALRSSLVLPEFDPQKHVSRDAAYRPGYPVCLWIDPGYSGSHYAVIAAQVFEGTVCVVDEIYQQYASHADMVNKAMARPWWRDVRKIVMDIAARQRTPASQSPLQVWRATGLPVVGRLVHVEAGIDVHRQMLAEGRILVHPSCVNTLREYRTWKRRKLADMQGTVLTEPEKHNCDAMKAIQYGLYVEFGPAARGWRRASPLRRERRWR